MKTEITISVGLREYRKKSNTPIGGEAVYPCIAAAPAATPVAASAAVSTASSAVVVVVAVVVAVLEPMVIEAPAAARHSTTSEGKSGCPLANS